MCEGRWCELNDVFAEIGLDRLDSGGFECVIEVDFLAGHRFRLDDEWPPLTGPHRLGRSLTVPFEPLANQIDDNSAGFRAIVGPMDMSAAGGDAFFQSGQMFVELGERGVFNRASSFADQIGVRQSGPGFAVAAAERIAELPKNLLQAGVRQGLARGRKKLVVGFAEVVGHCSRLRMTKSTIGATPISTAPRVIGEGGGVFRTR